MYHKIVTFVGDWEASPHLLIFKVTIMETIEIIKNSFESWYNRHFGVKASVVINYSDMQLLSIKAFHTVLVELSVVNIIDSKPDVMPLIKIQENYNHGETSEQEAKDRMLMKLLGEIYSYLS